MKFGFSAAALVVVLLTLTGCPNWDNYLQRAGRVAGQEKILLAAGDRLAARDFAGFEQLCGEDADAQRRVRQRLRDLDPVFQLIETVDFVEPELRNPDAFPELPEADLSFLVGARDADGGRHLMRLTSRARFRILEVASAEEDEHGMPVATVALDDLGPFAVEWRESRDQPLFVDATAQAGLTNAHRNEILNTDCKILSGTMPGGGACVLDFDRDGWPDLFAADGQSSRLYHNRGDGTFEDVSAGSGVEAVTGQAAIAADYDGDGLEDIYVADHFGDNVLLHNDGDGRFSDRTVAANAVVAGATMAAAFADIDLDGHLDLFVPRTGDYFDILPNPPFDARNGAPNVMLRNRGDGTFEDFTDEAGLDDNGWALACAFCDLDDDGAPDLYLANDFGVNKLYRNRGDGTFEDITAKAGAADRGYGMGVAYGDYDADGDFDIYIANIYSEYGVLYQDPEFPYPFLGRVFRGRITSMLYNMTLGNTLLRNNGNGTFTDVAKDLGVNECGWGWGGLLFDADNDGDLDIYAPNGEVSGDEPVDLEMRFWALSSLIWMEDGRLFKARDRSMQGYERNRFFLQGDDGSFDEVGYFHDVNTDRTTRGLALGDFNNDGFPDLYLRNVDEASSLYLGRGNENDWIRLELKGDAPNVFAIGAKVEVRAGKRRWIRQVAAGEGFFSGNDRRVLVGLGEAETVDVEVRWPRGDRQVFEGLATNRGWQLRKGQREPIPFDG